MRHFKGKARYLHRQSHVTHFEFIIFHIHCIFKFILILSNLHFLYIFIKRIYQILHLDINCNFAILDIQLFRGILSQGFIQLRFFE